MLLDGKETTVYLEVGDTEINFWDCASNGQLLAIAKYPEMLDGTANALKNCDYTDLNEDGNSDLTAEFSFADGSTASLVWFYADGGLIYNEEFSRLPGEMTGSGGHTMDLCADDVLTIHFSAERGVFRMKICAQDGSLLYSGNGETATDFTLNVPQNGSYTITVEARAAKGFIHIQAKRQ